jgi:Tol biopolymer transport system component
VSTRLQLVDLPERPIAFVYWAGKDGQKRAEIFEKAAEMQNPPTDGDDPERMEEMQIRAYLRGDETLPMRSQLAKYPGRLMLVWPQTGELERVEAAPVDAIPIDWSPDGKRLLIASGHRGGKEQLYEYHLDRRDLSPVTRGPFEHSRGGYDESGRLLVNQIERVRSQGVSANTVHWLRSGGRLGITLGDEVPPGTLRVAPAGDKIVYEQVRPRPRRNGPTILESMIAVRSVEVNSEEAVLIKGREPTLTPDGQWIVFASRSSAGYRLRRMRLDGSSRVAIGPGGTAERMPSVSPDGNFIAFVQSRSGRRRLAVRRFDGKDERILVSSGWCEFPVW